MDRFSERFIVCENEIRKVVGIETDSGEFKCRVQARSPLFRSEQEAMRVLLTQQYAKVRSLENQTEVERGRLAKMLRDAASLVREE